MATIPQVVWAEAEALGAVSYVSPAQRTYVVVSHAATRRVFVDTCPHRLLPLDRGGRFFFTSDQRFLVCANHGAKFDLLTGKCIAGLCVGKLLERVPEMEGPVTPSVG